MSRSSSAPFSARNPSGRPWPVLSLALVAVLGSVAGGGLAAADAVVNATSTAQVIRGFGGSTAWAGPISDADANSLFSYGNASQLGMSILRVRIDPVAYSSAWGGWGDELGNAQKAKARGAAVMATPWTPPAAMKSNGNTVGGSLKATEYGNYAAYLQSFCTFMANNGGALEAISVINEPDITVTYESCTWTGTQIRNFLKNNASVITTPIIASESFNFNTALTDPILNDSAATARLGMVGGHLYGANPFTYALAATKGKQMWMTEWYTNDASQTGMMTIAKQVNDCMANNYSAYLWWWIKDNSIGLINTSNVIQKRGYILSQYARFIRPGSTRVNATYNPTTNVYQTAYLTSGKLRIVALNTGTSTVSQKFVIQNKTVTSVIPTTTSASLNLSTSSAITVSSGTFTVSLPAQSVTTFVQP